MFLWLVRIDPAQQSGSHDCVVLTIIFNAIKGRLKPESQLKHKNLNIILVLILHYMERFKTIHTINVILILTQIRILPQKNYALL